MLCVWPGQQVFFTSLDILNATAHGATDLLKILASLAKTWKKNLRKILKMKKNTTISHKIQQDSIYEFLKNLTDIRQTC